MNDRADAGEKIVLVQPLVGRIPSTRRELLNWFAARGLFAHGATEGFNNKPES
jgi:hypothetical protein